MAAESLVHSGQMQDAAKTEAGLDTFYFLEVIFPFPLIQLKMRVESLSRNEHGAFCSSLQGISYSLHPDLSSSSASELLYVNLCVGRGFFESRDCVIFICI